MEFRQFWFLDQKYRSISPVAISYFTIAIKIEIAISRPVISCPCLPARPPGLMCQPDKENDKNKNTIVSVKVLEMRTATQLCMALCIAPNSLVHSNVVINNSISVRLCRTKLHILRTVRLKNVSRNNI